ncbi:hypothetical protein HRR80_000758 [Exophiala dermatitidis]|uniref:Cytochrome b561 domain-containing protein n=1 Tax=Exophiala dermatitidis TaxID=5970 RepID=A0AAN6IZP2_EXODE|nr:hypothetical protein HRR75_000677 [Exophiala dermatitidis]KAJ4530008.1 hypothetical protein HRR76_009250 [Exophiala dermatitidis]KAJ4552974.1 hypothetical protein HRR78_003233 [Exophiala dermatitidis]KAJ4558771.1 hypothetical protein HRR77_000751 [Exophiala dermatitidis]KAJ4581201.1 hypothetical protein HRR79_000248 [Exophiala dermatitidis]
MSPSPQLAPPGSSSYDSNTMHVGDGTWDAGRDTFLLPNLVGTNFATTRYNGMGNRFFTMTGYHSLVKAHGIIAAVTFLGAVPLAIFLMRFYGRQPRLALRLHIWLQILTLLLSTVVFILGFMAVGQNRSLTNPHHGIGVAIYVLIWVQVMGGCLLHRKEKRRKRMYIPVRAMLHHWLGRAIALLGITQIALGLTLYGSPLYLFVLYALFVFALVVTYFILQWLAERRRGLYGADGGSYYSDEVVSRPEKRKHTGLGGLAAAGAAGVALTALWRRRSSRSRRAHGGEGFGADESSASYISEEKVSDEGRHGFGHRLMQIGAIGGAVAAARKLFGGRGGRNDDDSDVGPYRPPLGGNQSVTTSDSMSRVEEGRPPPRPTTPMGGSPGYVRPTHPLAQPPLTPGSGRRPSGSSYSYSDSFASGSPSRRDRRTHTFRDAVAAGGTVFAVRQLFKNRRQRKEDIRAEALRRQRMEQERLDRMSSAHRYTGDGVPAPRRLRHDRVGSQTASDLSSALDSRPGTSTGAGAGLPVAGVGAAAASALADRDRIRPVGQDPMVHTPGPPISAPTDIPPVPPPHLDSSGSEMYTTGSGHQRHRHHQHRHGDEAAAGLTGAAVGAMAADYANRRHSGRNTDSMESPPVSLKVKMHNDGRHVTLRRLTEEEAAAQREERRRQRRASAAARQRRTSSFSGSDSDILGGAAEASAGTTADRRWRRTEALEAEQAAQNEAAAAAAAAGSSTVPPQQQPQQPPSTAAVPAYPTPPPPGTQGVDPRTGETYHVPIPPPIPASVSNLGGAAGSITSPGTETSGATEYANNRRRRRAERAQARLAREGRAAGNTVNFT